MKWIIIAHLALLNLTPVSSIASQIGDKLCKDYDHFSCHVVKKHQTWQSLFPNTSERDLVMRINRMNTPLYSGLHIAIPKSMSNTLNFAPFPNQINSSGNKTLIVSLKKLAWGAYDSSGYLIAWGPVSGAKGYCPDLGKACHTKLGSFKIYQKDDASCISSKFPLHKGGAPMPWCMFFYGGFALHGSYEVPGFNASHGCVRLFVSDAKWLNQEFIGKNFKNVDVIISNS